MSWDVEAVRPVSVAGAPKGAQGAGMTGYQNDLIGDHPSILALRTLIERVARSPAQNVLIYGPTGTGKGMVARMLHRLSARASKQFVDINCAAIPSSLLESELFGHEKGAFTGAVDRKVGLVEAANHGTIFLDEIREMEPMLQTKLLSLLDTHEFRRVGAVKTTSVDVRFIAATNKVLLSEVVAGNFREDLYFRLQVVAINIPALAERGDDVLKLSDYFISRFNARYKRAIKGLSPETAEIFLQYQWPGNVRELENLIERIFILEDDDIVEPHHLPDRILRTVRGGSGAGPASARADLSMGFRAATEAYQRKLIEQALGTSKNNLKDAAALLKISRHALRHQMLKLGMIDA
ncbi:sigma-54 dependent transcriptional regulator [Stappia stellulata]|uniref:sigma-54 interaction domain-containing protein n=1 Tax=Stappia stellulata TaxID=71235 RepID=UPI001CD47558|nr:sigma-54 dependent transcriptional regulator [Stappia stellulata]MCA1243430.1 sigma-54 dependent transcriptional regulator [Stappia stellulata]